MSDTIDLDAPATKRDLRLLEACLSRSPHPPPPHDLAAEQVVCCALLEGTSREGDLDGLNPEDFYGDLYRGLFTILAAARTRGVEPNVDNMTRALERRGWFVRNLEAELDAIRGGSPTILRGLRAYVDRVIGAARRRRALQHAERACALLRTATAPEAHEIFEQLEQASIELRGDDAP